MKASSTRSASSNPPAEVQPADPSKREEFARRELGERAEEARDQTPAREPDAVLPPAEGRDPLLDAQDATSVVRFGFLLQLYMRVRRGRADEFEVEQRRGRVDARAQRVGGRMGPRLGHMLGGALFWAGVGCETAAEALEEMIDGALAAQKREAAERQHQQQLARTQPQ